MSIERFFVRPGVIIRPLRVDNGYGSKDLDYDSGTQTAVKGWLHQLAESEQQSATRDAEVSTHVLRVPVGTDIASQDRVVISGQVFEVDGPPARAWRPGGEHHTRVSLKYVDG